LFCTLTFGLVRYLALFLPLFLAGCTDTGIGLLRTTQAAFGKAPVPIDTAKLDPRYRYLRLQHAAGTSGMILGAVESSPTGEVEVWYASDGELIRLENGRLAGNTGIQPEWRNVPLPALPAWSKLATQAAGFRWERVRDVMPGYRYGVRDKLIIHVVPPPASSGLVGMDAEQLVWFEERMESTTEELLPPARYAVQGERVVYGEQCLSRESCLKWQRWPAGS
jgi:hypothetical protein